MPRVSIFCLQYQIGYSILKYTGILFNFLQNDLSVKEGNGRSVVMDIDGTVWNKNA